MAARSLPKYLGGRHRERVLLWRKERNHQRRKPKAREGVK